jgi:FkbM family methyltransferase
MLKKILLKIENIIIKFILDYKNSDYWYLLFLNLKVDSSKYKFSKTFLDDSEPRFKITDLKTNKTIHFGYRKQGLMCYRDGIKQRGYFLANQYMIDTLKINQNDYIFDIGANTGDLNIYFNNINTKVNYYAFDPGLIEYNSLKLNVLEGNLYNVALGDKDGMATFYYKPEFGDSSIIEMFDYTKKYQVQVKRFDSFIEENHLEHVKIKLIKVEAEGFEPEIIKGIGKYLKNVEFISADLGFERGFSQDTTAPEVLEYLIKNNFEIIKINKDRFCFLLKNKDYEN